jgi:hypothetical protein
MAIPHNPIGLGRVIEAISNKSFTIPGAVAESLLFAHENRFCMLLNTFRLWIFFTLATLSASAAVIIPTDSNWDYLKGTSEASIPDPTLWRAVGFDDSSWSTGQAAFYYENSPGSATAYTGNTVLGDMFGNYTCLFMRQTFVITNLNDVSELQLSGLSDDGFLAWINGVNVASFNMPSGEIPFDGTALAALAEPVPVQTFTIANPRSFLASGTNVLAVQAFNNSLEEAAILSSTFPLGHDRHNSTCCRDPDSPGRCRCSQSDERRSRFQRGRHRCRCRGFAGERVPAAGVTMFNAAQYVFNFPQPPTGHGSGGLEPGERNPRSRGDAKQLRGRDVDLHP